MAINLSAFPVTMKKLLLTSVAALLLATGTDAVAAEFIISEGKSQGVRFW
jgi:hypothetical protein